MNILKDTKLISMSKCWQFVCLYVKLNEQFNITFAKAFENIYVGSI